MSIDIQPPKPKPLPFIQRAEGHIAKALADWRSHWLNGEPEATAAALEYSRREGFILPNEGLEAVSALNLMPNSSITDLHRYKAAIDDGSMTEADATKCVAHNVKSDLREHEAAINRIRFPDLATEPAPQGKEGKPMDGPVAVSPSPDPAPPVKTLPAASQSLRGTPEALTTTTRREHGVCFNGVYAYTLDKQMAADLQSAQVSGLTIEAVVVPGDFGLRLVSIKVINP